jgi:hypothetical protein
MPRTSTLARGSRALAVTTPENPADSNMRMAAEGYASAARARQPQPACWMALGVDLRHEKWTKLGFPHRGPKNPKLHHHFPIKITIWGRCTPFLGAPKYYRHCWLHIYICIYNVLYIYNAILYYIMLYYITKKYIYYIIEYYIILY